MCRPPKLDLEKKAKLYILARFLNKSNRLSEESLQYFLKGTSKGSALGRYFN